MPIVQLTYFKNMSIIGMTTTMALPKVLISLYLKTNELY